MNKLLSALVGLLLSASCALAQVPPVEVYLHNPTIGQPSLPVTALNPFPVTVENAITASLAPFTPGGQYATPLSVSGTSANVAVPTNTGTVAVYNVGANAAYCKLGTSNAVVATTSDEYVPANSAVGFGVGSNTWIACITASSTTTVNLSGGSGLLAGFGGGGSSGGSSGAVFGPTAGGTAAANPPVLIGGTIDGSTTGNVDNWKVATGLGYINSAALGGANLGAATAWGTPPSGNVQGVNDNVLVSVPEGTTADVPCTAPATSTACSLIAAAKAILNAATSPIPLGIANGWTPVVKLAITTAQTVKSSAGWLGKVYCDNPNASVAYLEVFNTTSPTLGTTAPLAMVPLAASTPGGYVVDAIGEQFSTAIAVAAVTAANGGTPVSTGLNCAINYN